MQESVEARAMYQGGCLCGAVRYEVFGSPRFPHLCSCRQCQRWSGAPVVGWVDFPKESVRWRGSRPVKFFGSSEGTQRGFCEACGGSLLAQDEGADTVCLTLASLDASDSFEIESHSFADLEPCWLTRFYKNQ